MGVLMVWDEDSQQYVPVNEKAGGGVTDHGALTGLTDDDHPQYHTDARGDARYYTQAQVDSSLAGKADTVHTHTESQITDLGSYPDATGQPATKIAQTDGADGWTFIDTPSGGGVTDHGALTGLTDDDHPQYHTDARGDARYYTQAQVDSSLAGKEDTGTAAAAVSAHEGAADPHPSYVLASGDEMTGLFTLGTGLNANNQPVYGLSEPVDFHHAATKGYVDGETAKKADTVHTHTDAEIVPSMRRVLTYYASPAMAGNWSVEAAIGVFSGFTDVIFGDKAADPGDPNYATTAQIVPALEARGVKVWGYIDPGVNPPAHNRPIAELQTDMDAWQAIGATGIFMDVFEYSWGTDRARQNTLVDYAHGLGMNVIGNGWVTADYLGDAVDPTYNPTGEPSHFTTGDVCYLESWVANSDFSPDPYWATLNEIKTRHETAVALADPLGVDIFATSVLDVDGGKDWYVYHRQLEALAKVFRLEGFGLDHANYSAFDGKVPPIRSEVVESPYRYSPDTPLSYALNGSWTTVTDESVGVAINHDPTALDHGLVNTVPLFVDGAVLTHTESTDPHPQYPDAADGAAGQIPQTDGSTWTFIDTPSGGGAVDHSALTDLEQKVTDLVQRVAALEQSQGDNEQ